MGEFSPIISETDGVELLVSVLVSILDPLSLKPLLHTQLVREARVGIEPTHTAFAEPRLTTWLPRRYPQSGKVPEGVSLRQEKVPGTPGLESVRSAHFRLQPGSALTFQGDAPNRPCG